MYESRTNKKILQIKASDVRTRKRIGLLQNFRLYESIIFPEDIYFPKTYTSSRTNYKGGDKE